MRVDELGMLLDGVLALLVAHVGSAQVARLVRGLGRHGAAHVHALALVGGVVDVVVQPVVLEVVFQCRTLFLN